MKKIFLWLIMFINAELLVNDGTLDPSFGTNGQVLTHIGVGGFDSALAVQIQSDNKIVTAGGNGTNFLITRYTTSGTLDTSFGSNGSVATPVGLADALVIQSDGKIVAAGSNGLKVQIARYNVDGSLDSSFSTVAASAINGNFNGLAIQQDEKIIAVGSVGFNTALLVRFNTDGTLDKSFNPLGATPGIVTTNFGDTFSFITAVAIQHDGKIVIAGAANSALIATDQFLVARYLTDGTLDSSFGTNGFALTDIMPGTNSDAFALAIQSDNKIVLAGTTNDMQNVALARYTPYGILDREFGNQGTVSSAFSGEVFGIALQSDGKIIVAGDDVVTPQSLTARYTSAGVLDASFGNAGVILLKIFNKSTTLSSVAINSSGKIIIAGKASNAGLFDIALAQYTIESIVYSPLSLALWQRYYNQNN